MSKNLKNQFKKLQNLKGGNNWREVRSIQNNFELLEKEYYHLGNKKIFYPIKRQKNVNLQSSRGVGIYEDDSLVSMLEKVESQMIVDTNDHIQIAEYKKCADALKKAGTPLKKSGFCELGFRIPKLLQFYKKQGFKKVVGYDINSFNVEVGKHLGYDCRTLDLNEDENINLSGYSFVACYHVLEHLSDPYNTLKKIVDSLDTLAILQVEVPIEGEIANLDIGHLFPFRDNDLLKMLETLPVEIVNTCKNMFFEDKIERYLCIKVK